MRLNLGLGPDDAKFVRGRPSMMTLHSERVQGAQHSLYVLRATWENVEEVVLVAGADTHASEPENPRDPDERFVRIALRRFRAMGSSRPAPQRGIIRVNRSCMLTLVSSTIVWGDPPFIIFCPDRVRAMFGSWQWSIAWLRIYV